MLGSLNAFLAEELSVGKLIADLEGLLGALQASDDDWKRLFWRYWGHLEEARAVALSRGATKLNEQESSVALDAANHLKLLVLEKIDDIYDQARNVD
jgi:hypothetical protein